MTRWKQATYLNMHHALFFADLHGRVYHKGAEKRKYEKALKRNVKVTSAIQWRDALGDPLTDSCSLSIGRSPYLSNLSSGGTGCIIQRLGKPYYIVHEVNFDLHLYDEI